MFNEWFDEWRNRRNNKTSFDNSDGRWFFKQFNKNICEKFNRNVCERFSDDICEKLLQISIIFDNYQCHKLLICWSFSQACKWLSQMFMKKIIKFECEFTLTILRLIFWNVQDYINIIIVLIMRLVNVVSIIVFFMIIVIIRIHRIKVIKFFIDFIDNICSIFILIAESFIVLFLISWRRLIWIFSRNEFDEVFESYLQKLFCVWQDSWSKSSLTLSEIERLTIRLLIVVLRLIIILLLIILINRILILIKSITRIERKLKNVTIGKRSKIIIVIIIKVIADLSII